MSQTIDPATGWKLVAPLLLAMPRIGAMLATSPLLTRHGMSSLTRNSVVLSLSLSVYPFMASKVPQADFSFVQWIGFTAKEVLIGGLLGYATGLLVWMLEGLGAIVDIQSGLGNVTLFEPFSGNESAVFATLMSMLGMVLFIGLGGLYVMLALLYDSYTLWPPTDLLPPPGLHFMHYGIDSVVRVASAATQLALPTVLVLSAIDLGLGMVARAAPQLNVFFFSGPIKSAAAALMLALSLSYLLDYGRGFVASMQGSGGNPLGAALVPR